ALFLQEIRRQYLDRRLGRGGADRLDGGDELPRPAILEIVAIDRGDDDVRKAELCRRLGDMLRLVRVQAIGPAGRDIAEGAGAGADRTEDHHRRVLFLPALTDIGTGRL